MCSRESSSCMLSNLLAAASLIDFFRDVIPWITTLLEAYEGVELPLFLNLFLGQQFHSSL